MTKRIAGPGAEPKIAIDPNAPTRWPGDLQRAYKFVCPAEGTQSSLYLDPAQVRSEALDHFATHPLPHWLPVLMGERPLPRWLTTYSLIEEVIPPIPPTPAELARGASQRISDLLSAAEYWLAERAPCTERLGNGLPCGSSVPKFEFVGGNLRVDCGECGKPRFTVTSEVSA